VVIKYTPLFSLPFCVDSLLVEEMMHTKGIEAIKELFRKHNVRLAGD